MSHRAAKRTRVTARRLHDKKARATIDPILRQFITNLRNIFKRVAKASYEQFPNQGHPCSTCALNPATDTWEGWDATALRLSDAIQADAPFYCHDGWPIVNGAYKIDLKKAKLCAAWAIVYPDPETKDAMDNAILAHPPISNGSSHP